MKNKFTVLPAILLVLTVGFGCSFIQKATTGGGSDNSSNSAVNSSNDSAKTGVAECDELLDLINNDQKNA